jgi:hypothetical protein
MKRIAMIVVIATCVTTAAQTNQGLKSTTDWMRAFVADNSMWHIKDLTDDSVYSSTLTFNGCQVKQSLHRIGTSDPTPATYSLSDLDPKSIKAYSGYKGEAEPVPFVSFETTNSQRKISLAGHACAKGLTEVVDRCVTSWQVNFVEYDAAVRFAKAMHHAVTLCGGKVSTF